MPALSSQSSTSSPPPPPSQLPSSPSPPPPKSSSKPVYLVYVTVHIGKVRGDGGALDDTRDCNGTHVPFAHGPKCCPWTDMKYVPTCTKLTHKVTDRDYDQSTALLFRRHIHSRRNESS
ncbi:hypothetical protein FKW77_010901 [Venturia effusa]|uniref:Uncharacterized protein n=1 Tax=Venturia effusa TaxID=50376 RepID=A0A517KYT3_9PEZI|nr:hypothetical protein FKW77_010901 [Venturia effusa]